MVHPVDTFVYDVISVVTFFGPHRQRQVASTGGGDVFLLVVTHECGAGELDESVCIAASLGLLKERDLLLIGEYFEFRGWPASEGSRELDDPAVANVALP